jgi:hypothetical protein
VLNFHGFGNEIDDPGSAEFYRVTQDAYTVSPLFLIPLTQHGNIAFGPYFKYASTDNRTDRFLATVNPYGSGNFGEVGAGVAFRFDSRNRLHAATRGWTVEVTGRVFPAWWDVEEDFGDVAVEATTFLSPKLPLHPTFAFRAGGKKIWGPYPYFEAAYIGDAGTVRLGRDNRYAGDASAYGNAELRLGLVAPPSSCRPISECSVWLTWAGFSSRARTPMSGIAPSAAGSGWRPLPATTP